MCFFFKFSLVINFLTIFLSKSALLCIVSENYKSFLIFFFTISNIGNKNEKMLKLSFWLFLIDFYSSYSQSKSKAIEATQMPA